MKALAVIQQVKAIGWPWAGWTADLLARYGRWTDATRLPLSFFIPRMRPGPGGAPVQRLEHVQHHWLSSRMDIHLAVSPRVLQSDATQVVPTGPTHLQMARIPLHTALVQQRQPYFELHVRRPNPSLHLTAIGLAARRHFASTAAGAANLLKVMQSKIPLPSSLRQEALVRRHKMALNEVSRVLVERARRISDAPPSPLRMQLRRVTPVIAAMSESPQLPAASAWRQPVGGTGRGADPAVPMIAVEHLASQVLREIDRRVTARRERMGQR
jgi:hypothetical protein